MLTMTIIIEKPGFRYLFYYERVECGPWQFVRAEEIIILGDGR